MLVGPGVFAGAAVEVGSAVPVGAMLGVGAAVCVGATVGVIAAASRLADPPGNRANEIEQNAQKPKRGMNAQITFPIAFAVAKRRHQARAMDVSTTSTRASRFIRYLLTGGTVEYTSARQIRLRYTSARLPPAAPR